MLLQNEDMNIIKPLVSIITPVYKVEEYINRCIESVIAQTYTNWELILVDDGSPDRSGEICDDWEIKDNRIRVIHKINGGVSSARNEGLKHARGTWVMFIDSDDWFAQDCLETCIREVEINDLDVLQFDFTTIDCNNKFKRVSGNHCNVCALEEYVQMRCVGVNVWQGIYKKSIIDAQRLVFNTKMKYAEDGVFVCEFLSNSSRIMHIDNCLYYYYKNVNSVMNKKDIDAYLDSMLLQIEFLDKHPVFQPMYSNLVTMNIGGIDVFDTSRRQRKRMKEIWYKYKDNTPYVHLKDYHESISVKFFFIPLQKISFTLACFFTAIVTCLYRTFKSKI